MLSLLSIVASAQDPVDLPLFGDDGPYPSFVPFVSRDEGEARRARLVDAVRRRFGDEVDGWVDDVGLVLRIDVSTSRCRTPGAAFPPEEQRRWTAVLRRERELFGLPEGRVVLRDAPFGLALSQGDDGIAVATVEIRRECVGEATRTRLEGHLWPTIPQTPVAVDLEATRESWVGAPYRFVPRDDRLWPHCRGCPPAPVLEPVTGVAGATDFELREYPGLRCVDGGLELRRVVEVAFRPAHGRARAPTGFLPQGVPRWLDAVTGETLPWVEPLGRPVTIACPGSPSHAAP